MPSNLCSPLRCDSTQGIYPCEELINASEAMLTGPGLHFEAIGA